MLDEVKILIWKKKRKKSTNFFHIEHFQTQYLALWNPSAKGQNTSLYFVLGLDVLYLRANRAITLVKAIPAHRNDTLRIAGTMEQWYYPDHNDTGMLYLGLFGINKALLPCLTKRDHRPGDVHKTPFPRWNPGCRTEPDPQPVMSCLHLLTGVSGKA